MAAGEGGSEKYRNVVISLENVVLDYEKLLQTPSRRDGLDREVEIDLRIVGCEFIQIAGNLLKLPQVHIELFTDFSCCISNLSALELTSCRPRLQWLQGKCCFSGFTTVSLS